MDIRTRYHDHAISRMTDEQRASIARLTHDEDWNLDGVLPDGDLLIYCSAGHDYYRVERDGRAYEVTERRVTLPSDVHATA